MSTAKTARVGPLKNPDGVTVGDFVKHPHDCVVSGDLEEDVWLMADKLSRLWALNMEALIHRSWLSKRSRCRQV